MKFYIDLILVKNGEGSRFVVREEGSGQLPDKSRDVEVVRSRLVEGY